MLGVTFSLGLAGCSTTTSTSSSSTSTEQTAAQKRTVQKKYQQALTDLKRGADQQAYTHLKSVVASGLATADQKKLYNQAARLLEVKKNLAAGKFTAAQNDLAVLENVDQPSALVKQVNALKKELQASKLAKLYYQEIVNYYQAGKVEAAGGSLQALQDLSSKYQLVAAYQNKAAKYETLISQQAKSSAVSSSSATSGYTNARNSKIVSSTYAKATGSSIESATNSQVSSVAETLSNDQLLDKFFKVSQIPQEAGDQYYIKQLNGQTYQIEIRHTSSTDSNISNLKGMYQFNISTQKISKLNVVSGEYVPIN
jgi:hypothetical protein